MNVRGLIPSLGAGASLIAAALCAVALVGGTLAFRGGAGGTAEANAGDVTLPSRTVRAQTSSSGLVEPVLTLATVGRRTAPTDRPARPRLRRRVTTVTPGRETAPRATIRPRTPAPAAAAPAAPAPTAPRPAEATPAPDAVTGTVQRAVAQVHAVADPVMQHVPDPAGQHAESLTQTVDQVAQTVDALLP
jgi:hypothetical protein